MDNFFLDHPILGIGVITLGMFGLIGLAYCIQWSTGEQTLTGYVYSAEDKLGNKTVGHLRFSETAGEDSQPSFCVQKKDGHTLKELAGSGKKVRVKIPAGFAFAPYWDCAIPASVEVMEGGE